jgi:hypothetical protein
MICAAPMSQKKTKNDLDKLSLTLLGTLLEAATIRMGVEKYLTKKIREYSIVMPPSSSGNSSGS